MKHLRILKHLAILIAMLSGGAWADDCKPIAEALAKQANTSFRVIYHGTEWDKNGQCNSYAGLSRHNAGDPSYFPYVGADAFPKVSACRTLGATTISGASTEHFYAAIEVDASEKLFSEFWISPDTGLVLKRSEVRPDKTTVIEYEYDKLDSIF
jgi:hypothetical protein